MFQKQINKVIALMRKRMMIICVDACTNIKHRCKFGKKINHFCQAKIMVYPGT